MGNHKGLPLRDPTYGRGLCTVAMRERSKEAGLSSQPTGTDVTGGVADILTEIRDILARIEAKG